MRLVVELPDSTGADEHLVALEQALQDAGVAPMHWTTVERVFNALERLAVPDLS